jgi:hypothetical protein
VSKAVETSATIDERGHLELDEPIAPGGPRRVRVIVLLPADNFADEREWLEAVAHNPAFDFLSDPSEEVYSASDGQPFRDPR